MAESGAPSAQGGPPRSGDGGPWAAEFRFLGELERYDVFLKLYHSEEPSELEALGRLTRSPDPLVGLILLQYLQDLPEKKAVLPIIRMIEGGNEIVSRAAMAAYGRNHYPGKPHLLKRLILSPDARACRFAVRTLSRAGFMDALPLILRELLEREGKVRSEMVESLRFLPDRRSLPTLLPLAQDKEEEVRFLALQALAELQLRERVLPSDFFLRRVQDESERIRRAALEALQRLPTRKVSRIFLRQALDPEAGEPVRERAVRALAAFPSAEWGPSLVRLLVADEPASLKLAAEISLKALSPPLLRAALLPFLDDPDVSFRRQAALLLAQFLGEDPAVRRRIHRLWREAKEEEAGELADVLSELGGVEEEALLMEAMTRSPLLAFSAAAALSRTLRPGSGPRVLSFLKDPRLPHTVKQALLTHWAKRGPDEPIRAELKPWLTSALGDEIMNIRYLSLQVLGWYPLEDRLPSILDLLTRETNPEIVRMSYRQLLKGLGRDPIPLALAVEAHEGRDALIGHMVRVLTDQGWDEPKVLELLHILRRKPLDLLARSPEAFFAVCIHLLEKGGVALEKVWLYLDEGPLRLRFLLMLLAFMRSPGRRFSALPLDFLTFHLRGADAPSRALYFGLLAADGRPESAEELTAALLREKDPAMLAEGRSALRRLLAAEPGALRS